MVTRQNRLWRSCTPCRTRKVRCDRGRPCRRCIQSGRQDQCQYEPAAASSAWTTPGQLVFPVEAPSASEGINEAVGDYTIPGAPSGSGNEAGPFLYEAGPNAHVAGSSRNELQLSSAATTLTATTETGPVAPLQLLWHGSRAVDVYVEPVNESIVSTPKEVIFGENDATVHWGRSHETNFVPRITDAALLVLEEPDNEDNLTALYRIERSTRPGDTVPVRTHDPELRALLPPRAETDRLVDIYLRTFTSYYKILHVPTFLGDYGRLWDPDPVVSGMGPPTFLAQLLGICAIGLSLVTADTAIDACGTITNTVTQRASQWIESVRLWLFKQDPRMQMTIGHLEAHLLMLVAGDVHWIKIDRSWISSGMLVRHAISAGLHREPSDFTRITPFYTEQRRRLWYAILEFDLQASFAKGRSPAVRDDDYDCRIPEPVHGDEIIVASEIAGPLDGFQPPFSFSEVPAQQTPAQPFYLWLAKSLSLRMRICRLINGINLTSDYDKVLKLDAELDVFLSRVGSVIQSEPDTRVRILLAIICRRPTLTLHAPFRSRTLRDPKYLYSRQVSVDTATAILEDALSLLDASGRVTPFFSMVNNICRCEIANSVFLLCHELLIQAVERRRSQRRRQHALDMEQKKRQQTVVDLVESAARATAAICKPDIVSQRTCAWMQLSAELSRAAAGDEARTVVSMKEAIGRSIQAYRATIQHVQTANTTGINNIDENLLFGFTDSGNMLDEDYFNLFLNLNNFEMQ